MLEKYPYSAAQVWQRLREQGFEGGYSMVKVYVGMVRPKPQPAFLKLAFAPGECAQVDWGLCRARHRPHYADTQTMPIREVVFGYKLHTINQLFYSSAPMCAA